MNMPAAVVAGCVLAGAATSRSRRLAIGGVVVAIAPRLGLAVALIVMVAWHLHRRNRARDPVPDQMTVVRVAHLVAIGLAAGLTVEASLRFCAARGPREVRRELSGLVRTVQSDGLAAAANHRGVLGPLLASIGGAMRTGAPVALVVRSFAEQQRADHLAARVARARRLPGKLSIPLALLVLPGFVLMVMGPAVLVIAERMVRPLIGL